METQALLQDKRRESLARQIGAINDATGTSSIYGRYMFHSPEYQMPKTIKMKNWKHRIVSQRCFIEIFRFCSTTSSTCEASIAIQQMSTAYNTSRIGIKSSILCSRHFIVIVVFQLFLFSTVVSMVWNFCRRTPE